jgi:phage shock protein B
MDCNVTGVLIVAIVFGSITISRYLKTRASMGNQLNANDQAALEQMGQTAQRLEQRVMTLERILDAEVPAWRSQYGTGAGRPEWTP